jgi:protein-disulfide isomerase
VEIQVEKIQDYAAMARAGIMSTPVIEINGQVVAKGRTPKVSELVSWIRAARD